MKASLLLCLLTVSVLVNAQELKRVTKSNLHWGEVYYVLKADRHIKQGKYLKYFESMNLYDKAIESYGNYENNKRTGAWIFCDPEAMNNPIISIGEYLNDKRIGNWVFFYEPAEDSESFVDLSGTHKHTRVVIPTSDNEQIFISLDTTGIKTAALGTYNDNNKSGVWCYYFRNGSLACQYDFSTNSMILENGLDSYDQLGGINRFKALFHKSFFEDKIKNQPFYFQDAIVVFELTTNHGTIDIKLKDSNGSILFANSMEKILRKMPSDWINYDPRLEENKIKIQISYVVKNNEGTVSLDSIKPMK